VAGWWDPEHAVEGSVGMRANETLGSLISTDGGVRRLTRDVFRAVAPRHAYMTAEACNALGTFRLLQSWTCKLDYAGLDPETQVMWAELDPETQVLLAELDEHFAQLGVECSVSTSMMGYDLAHTTSADDCAIRLPRDVSCAAVRLFRLPAGTVCPKGLDITLDRDDGHVTIRLTQATRVKVVAGVVNDPHVGDVCAPIIGGGVPGNGVTLGLQWEPYGVCIKRKRATAPEWLGDACVAALNCLVAECAEVETVSAAVDIWNSECDQTANLETLLHDVLDLEDVEPEHADLYITALQAIRASTNAL
jgi:hypothetical protein